MSWLILLTLSFLAAIVDSSVGGGGLIRLPAILAFGLPPHLALGTNKLGATGASLASAVQYWRSGIIEKQWAKWAWLIAALASAAGAYFVLQVNAEAIVWLIIGAIALLLAYSAAQPTFGLHHGPKAWIARGSLVAACCFGFYDGFLGPGTGTFLIIALVFMGMDMRRAAAHGRILNFGSNLGALAVFALFGFVNYKVGAALFVTNVVGGLIGSTLTLRVDPKWIRVLFYTTAVALLCKLLWDQLVQ